MKSFVLAILASFLGLALATNTSIHFFSDQEGCINNWFGCSNLDVGYCCTSSNPYCRWVTCNNCHSQGVTSYTLPTYKTNTCSGDLAATPACGATAIDNCCSVADNANPPTCSAKVVPASGKRQGNTTAPQECLGTVEPDTIHYTGPDGGEHTLDFPAGTFLDAVGFLEANDWEGLAGLLGPSS